jgi:phosphate transport system ATP-binding protein
MVAQTHISVQNLNVFYGKQQALKNISLDIPDKKIIAIIGPSGCGKTTLLKSFNRLIDSIDGVKASGEVLVDGENVFDARIEVTHIRKKMGLLAQSPYPLPMSIYDNVAYGPRIHGLKDRKRLNEIVEYYLRESSLWDEVKDRLHTPTSALDPKSSLRIEQSFLRLKEKYTIIIVTHILRQARRLADYIIFLYLGEVIEHGPAQEIFENPKEQMTKEYIMGVIS